jgi:hypothetical protein
MLVFLVWVSRGKISVYCVYVPLYFFCSFTENMFVLNNCTRLKSTFGIRALLDLGGCLNCGQGFGLRL